MFRLGIEWVEAEDTYSLSAVQTLQDAVNTIIKFLGLGPANLSEKVAEGVATHTLLCSGNIAVFFIEVLLLKQTCCCCCRCCYVLKGTFRGGAEILVRAKLALSEGVTMQLTVRTTDSDVAELVTAAIG